MCGIAGFVSPHGQGPHDHTGEANHESAERLRQMCDVIRHRGPDDEGMFVADGAALGMRRLSIIDLAGGHQPIRNEDGTLWVVFNGEIYNYRELRAELTAHGHTFYTETDTETIVHAYEQWGEEAFTHLRGMFGIALWNRRNRTLVLARDRVGIKPLHYAEHDGTLSFGSEIKSLLVDGQGQPGPGRAERALNPAALGHYLSYLYTPADTSIFTGIKKLPPGHLLRWDNGQVSVRRYWDLPARESFTGSLPEASEALTQVLADAVQSHLVSDVPLGALLSGGIDSSLVVALMARASSRPIKTFSIGFDEPAFDELDAARRLARHFATDHHELVVRPDALDVVDRLVEHFDEPFGDSSAIPTWYVFEMARRHVTVVLSGDGGDELFGGYDRYLPHPRVARFDALTGRAGRAVAGATWPLIPHGVHGRNFLRHVAQGARERYLDSIRLFQPDELRALLAGDFGEAIDLDRIGTAAADRFGRLAALPWASQMMHFDLDTYLPEDILTKVDRMSMAHSIESRVPILDHNVVTFAASLPHDMKIRHGERKVVLKHAAAKLLPTEVLTRRKQGFGVPVGDWFRGPLKNFMTDALQSARARQRGYFNPRFVDRLVAEHLSGRRDHASRLWPLLMFELWHRRYLDGATRAVGSLRDSSMPLGRAGFPQKDKLTSGSPLPSASTAPM